MAANSTLYLQDPPLSFREGPKIVTFTPMTSSGTTPGSSGNTSKDVAEALAAMTQGLLDAMQKMVQFSSTQSKQNAIINQLNTAVASQQANDAVKAMETLHSFWYQFLTNFLQPFLQVLGPIIAAVGLVLAGATGGALAALVFLGVLLVTMVPVHEGKAMLTSLVNVVVQAIGDACGWSEGTKNLVAGIADFVAGIALAFATAGVTFVTTVIQKIEVTVVNEVAQVVEGVVNKVIQAFKDVFAKIAQLIETMIEKMVGKGAQALDGAAEEAAKAASLKLKLAITAGLNAGTSQLSSSNCFQNIFLGIFLNAGMDEEKSKMIASIIGTIMNILCMVGTMIYGATTAGNLLGTTSEFRPVSLLNTVKKLLGDDSRITKFIAEYASNALTFLRNVQVVTGTAYAGSTALNGVAQQQNANLQADLTRIKGQLTFLENNGKIISEMMNLSNHGLKDVLKKYNALEQAPNYFTSLYSEAQAMLHANQQA
jgi:hypothetical protein